MKFIIKLFLTKKFILVGLRARLSTIAATTPVHRGEYIDNEVQQPSIPTSENNQLIGENQMEFPLLNGMVEQNNYYTDLERESPAMNIARHSQSERSIDSFNSFSGLDEHSVVDTSKPDQQNISKTNNYDSLPDLNEIAKMLGNYINFEELEKANQPESNNRNEQVPNTIARPELPAINIDDLPSSDFENIICSDFNIDAFNSIFNQLNEELECAEDYIPNTEGEDMTRFYMCNENSSTHSDQISTHSKERNAQEHKSYTGTFNATNSTKRLLDLNENTLSSQSTSNYSNLSHNSSSLDNSPNTFIKRKKEWDSCPSAAEKNLVSQTTKKPCYSSVGSFDLEQSQASSSEYTFSESHKSFKESQKMINIRSNLNPIQNRKTIEKKQSATSDSTTLAALDVPNKSSKITEVEDAKCPKMEKGTNLDQVNQKSGLLDNKNAYDLINQYIKKNSVRKFSCHVHHSPDIIAYKKNQCQRLARMNRTPQTPALAYTTPFYTEPIFNETIQKLYKLYKNIWLFISSLTYETHSKKMDCIIYLCSLPIELKKALFSTTNSISCYYNGFLDDLYNYIYNMGSPQSIEVEKAPKAVFIKKEFIQKNETIQDIYDKKGIDPVLLIHGIIASYSQINHSDITSQGKEKNKSIELLSKIKDIPDEIQNKLGFILKIPEIYEDMFHITEKVINQIRDRVAIGFNKKWANSFFIINALAHIVQKSKFKLSDNDMQAVCAIKINRVPIINCKPSEVLDVMLNLFRVFYINAPYIYETTTPLTNAEVCDETSIKGINMPSVTRSGASSCASKTILRKLLGKNVITVSQFNRCYALITSKITYKTQSNKEAGNLPSDAEEWIDSSVVKSYISYFQLANDIPITHSIHYHIQLVLNSKHRVKIIHLPRYTVVNSKNRKFYNKLCYTIKNIVVYLDRLISTNPVAFGINIKTGQTFLSRPTKQIYEDISSVTDSKCIYPAVYNRTTKKWTMMSTTDLYMDKTMHEMNKKGLDVIFYYLEESVLNSSFIFAQFNPSSSNNRKNLPRMKDAQPNPRIPLFLSTFLLSSIPLSSYYPFKKTYMANINLICNTAPFQFNYSSINSIFFEGIPNKAKILKNYEEITVNYYSDFFIRNIYSEYKDLDCYCLNSAMKQTNNPSQIVLEWNVRITQSVDEYTTYYYTRPKDPEKSYLSEYSPIKALKSLVKMLQSPHISEDMVYYGICLYKNKDDPVEYTSFILCPVLRSLLDKTDDSLIKKSYKSFVLSLPPITDDNMEKMECAKIIVKENNYTMSKLGIHCEIWDILTSNFKNTECYAPSTQKQEAHPSTSAA
ncbi:hypothetical protein NEPAR06_1441 [Nematocida parisii]|nr:uncharacterized protein NEPG_02239 [Nematocida parisii ERTm1]KAI5142035.1 hypothetical protein NEPAR04_1391 [Nematocida parisii]EIJ92840.1 hypothetical protein NEPG_02239 [Nematocida parisii ERTm1]KAI5145078.1 hypothetical protein NEPAR07_1447 [Nematocida parisii]KAI5154983.1 hypothetical protein NEPAR06_1441 [Nematocida parisii]KAI5157691.1 hypothetical protein NEPAR05_1501 [Nematocida parisii]|eukprot:XP_013060066.1 hypothetical protein NEPG_02239 [Nematocida parisii ERTm1]